MALTIDKTTDLTSDVYGINSYVDEVKKLFNPDITEDTLLLGIYGYTGQLFSTMLQNSIVMASEFSNESIPTKAKFEKNVIAHALGLGITDINAVPAQFDVLLTFLENDITAWAGATNGNGDELPWEFTFDKDTAIYIGDYCFHVDYDILIRKVQLENSGGVSTFAYTAKYLIDVDNPISDVTNPYLTSPVKMNVNGTDVIFTKCTLRQVKKSTSYKKILSDSSISSKTITFEFDGQLAAFTMDVTEGSTTTHMVPVYEGLSTDNLKYPYFYYTYLDSKTIRIKFDSNSYAPRINSEISINIQITEGEDGNFTYNPDSYPSFAFSSDKYGYSNIGCEIRPVTGESLYGVDKKSVDDLKLLIPKEALSRGSITNLSDLENFFNMLNTDDSILYFYKKRDNALERLYYSYILIRDAYNVIIPTNTIDLKVTADQLQMEEGSYKLVFKRGQTIKLSDDYGTLYEENEDSENDYSQYFMYTIPYNFIINTDPLYSIYFLTTMNINKFLDFSYINEECLYQYISTSVNWYRNYIENPDTYELIIHMEQNIDDDVIMVNYDEENNISDTYIRCLAVFYDDEENAYRWAEAELTNYDTDSNIYSFKFKFTTEDYIDIDNRIRIDTGMYDINSNNESYAHLPSNSSCIIHILTKQDQSYGLNKLDELIPDLEGYTLSNSYTVTDGIDFFYDYSEIINSTVIVDKDENDTEFFTVKNVPVVKYDYFSDEDKSTDFCSELIKRKNYIDYAIEVLEDAFGMDFKFFNTYGPSQLFTTDDSEDYLNKTNLSLTFKIKLETNYDTNVVNDIISDIKEYIEDINSIESLHIPNLITEITTTYRESLVFFEFLDMNGYGPSVQHLYSKDMESTVITPEFLSVSALDDGTPDITLIMV